ncbi:MAG: hypothetical protein OXG47_03225 [bacterium]|nr:hypothetical protein [bacterium]
MTELSPYCAELQAISDEISAAVTTIDGGLAQIVGVVYGLVRLEAYLARLESRADVEIASNFGNVRKTINDASNVLSLNASLDDLLVYVLLNGINLLPDLEAIDHYTSRECSGLQLFQEFGEEEIPISPRPTDDGRGVIIDGRNIYGERMCDDLYLQRTFRVREQQLVNRPFFDGTFTILCADSAGDYTMLLFSTATWQLLDVAEYPDGVQNVSSGGPTIVTKSESVIPASGLEPERTVRSIHIWQRSSDGFSDPIRFEVESDVEIRGVTADGNIVLGTDLLEPDGSLLATNPNGWLVVDNYLFSIDHDAIRDLDADELSESSRSHLPLLRVHDSVGVELFDFTDELVELVKLAEARTGPRGVSVKVCGDNVLLNLEHSIIFASDEFPDLVTNLTERSTVRIPYVRGQSDRYLMTPYGAVLFKGGSISNYSPVGNSWSLDVAAGLIRAVFSYGGRIFAVNSSLEYLELDSKSGELLNISEQEEIFPENLLDWEYGRRLGRNVGQWYITDDDLQSTYNGPFRSGNWLIGDWHVRTRRSSSLESYELAVYEVWESTCTTS